MCCKAEASDCASNESILLAENDKRKERKHSKFKLNKEELCSKTEANACAPEPIWLPEKDNEK